MYLHNTIRAMEEKVKFKVSNHRGEIFYKTLKMEFPDFEVQEGALFVDAGDPIPYVTSVEDQIISYLDEMDKTQLMNTNGWSIIFDYSVSTNKKIVPKGSKKEEVFSIAEELYKDDTTGMFNFLAVYQSLYPSISGNKPVSQVEITLRCLGNVHKGIMVKLDEIIKSLSEKDEVTKEFVPLSGNCIN